MRAALVVKCFRLLERGLTLLHNKGTKLVTLAAIGIESGSG